MTARDPLDTWAAVAAEQLRRHGHCYPSDLHRLGVPADAIAAHYPGILARAARLRAARPAVPEGEI